MSHLHLLDIATTTTIITNLLGCYKAKGVSGYLNLFFNDFMGRQEPVP